MKGTLQQRFEAKVMPMPWSGCWVWLHANCNGYGVIRDKGKTVGAHRVSFELFKGKIPDGLTIDHLCKNPSCVNPAHLEAVTMGENVRRAGSFLIGAAMQKAKTHCVRGHEYAGENVAFRKSGARRCRKCYSEKYQERRNAKG